MEPQAKSEQLQIICQVELASSSVFKVMHLPVSHYKFLLKASATSHYCSRERQVLLKTKQDP